MAHNEMTGRNFTERRPHRLFTREEFNYLILKVTTYYRVDEFAMYGNFRGNVTHDLGYRARQVVMYIAWTCYDTSFNDIAAYFSQPKTTARKAAEQVEDWRGAQEHLNTWLNRIEQEIIQRRLNRGKRS